ncbi:MAG: oxygen-independent coproporphyrinogen III oxidase [Caulobacterales bacterium]|nr:oxygen-independent coproporphyrinogen III oxidase [Caulobacterales bacterium]
MTPLPPTPAMRPPHARRLPDAWAEAAGRRLPRYTSYPTARSFGPVDAHDPDEIDRAVRLNRPGQRLSAYVHVPFCRRLCWYCGCHTSVVHDYRRVAEFHRVLLDEVDLWANRIGEHGGLAHLHFGGGSPNALSPEDFAQLVARIGSRLDLRPGAEVAVELDPALLSSEFAQAAGAAGVTRASLGVQTFDPDVQARINRIQDYDRVAAAVSDLRQAGVDAINLDLMYGLPGQTPANVAATAEQALSLRPDRLAVFGYAHVPWMKKHQDMIHQEELAGVSGRWDQAVAIDSVLTAAGYVRIGLDHYARADDALTQAAISGRLRRNFQGYTDDAADTLIPIGPSSIGTLEDRFIQNAPAQNQWRDAIAAGRLPVSRRLNLSADDHLRAAVIERLMCDLRVDVEAQCRAHGFAPNSLDAALALATPLTALGLCRIEGRSIGIPEPARHLMRVVAACFDSDLPDPARASAAV